MLYRTKITEFTCAELQEKLAVCRQYLQEHDVKTFAPGVYEINPDIAMNVLEYVTQEEAKRGWEAHYANLDYHVLLQGEERLDIGNTSQMHAGRYVAKDDYLPLEGEAKISIHMKPQDDVLLFCEDAHRTGVKEANPCKVKKAIRMANSS